MIHKELGKAIATGRAIPEIGWEFYSKNSNKNPRIELLEGVFTESQVDLDPRLASVIQELLDIEDMPHINATLRGGAKRLIVVEPFPRSINDLANS